MFNDWKELGLSKELTKNWTVQQKLLTARKQEISARNQKENNIECKAALTGEVQLGKNFHGLERCSQSRNGFEQSKNGELECDTLIWVFREFQDLK